eukprot:m.307901 g.307901  ORF g.307901 m.307901 type:complete len:400 (+) comp16466_c1_seq16:163-1362(+)
MLQLKDVVEGTAATVALLTKHGITGTLAEEKAALFAEAGKLLVANGVANTDPVSCYFVPGRIEVLGKHTDYAGGRSLLAAISKAFCIVCSDRTDNSCSIYSTDKPDDPVITTMGSEEDSTKKLPQGHWSNYPLTALRRICRNFGSDTELKGVNMSIACDIPAASGMSTSSAIICGVWIALSNRNNLKEHPNYKANIKREEDLMEYLGCCENGQNFRELIGDKGVGTFGGSEDHTAIMSCTPGNLHMYSYCPTVKESIIAFPSDMTFIIAVSGAIAEKTGDKMKSYNDASLLAKEAARVYCESTGSKIEPLHLANCVKASKDSGASDVLSDVSEKIKSHLEKGAAAAFSVSFFPDIRCCNHKWPFAIFPYFGLGLIVSIYDDIRVNGHLWLQLPRMCSIL